MFDELWPSDLIPWAIAAVVLASAIGCLPRSRLRLFLISAWTLLPALLIGAASLATGFRDLATTAPVAALFSVAALLPWVALTFVSYHVVRGIRQRLDS